MIANLSLVKLNDETAYLMEALKVESYYSRNNNSLTFQNKDIFFLKRIEEIVAKLGMNISKRLLIKIRLSPGLTKDNIKIISENNFLKFYIEKSPFDSSKIKAVMNISYKDNFEFLLRLNNVTQKYNIKITDKEILCRGDGECWAYKDLRFPNKRIFAFLDKYSSGKNNFSEYLHKADSNLIIAAFSALIDAEGSINWYNLTRKIRVRMRNEKYLREWDRLLNNLGIGCKFSKNKQDWQITIYGWEDFKKLKDLGLKLYHSKKAEEFDRIMKGFKRNQISRNSYKIFYTKKLKDLNRRVSTSELSKLINKKYRTVSHYLTKLEKEGIIKSDKSHEPYKYFISKKY